jgi:hypothetical protein
MKMSTKTEKVIVFWATVVLDNINTSTRDRNLKH